MFIASSSLVLAKIETNYGEDPTPAGATDAIITLGAPELSIVGSMRERNVPMATFGKLKGVNVGEALKLSFTTEFKHSGTAATAPRIGCLFQACGMTESGTTSVIYTPNSLLDTAKSVTIYFYHAGVLHKLIGCRGTYKINLKPGEIATIDWDFTGLYANNAADTALASATYDSVAPIIVKSLGATFKTVSLSFRELILDIGNNVVARKDCNAANNGVSQYIISNRESKGSMKVEAVPLSTLNPWNLWDTADDNAIAMDITADAGKDFAISCAGAIVDIPKYSDDENVLTWDLTFNFHPSLAAGNNEIIITFK